MVEEWVVLAGALAAGFALGALTILGVNLWRRRPQKAAAEEVVPLEPVLDEPAGFEPAGDTFGVVHGPRGHAPPRSQPASAPVQSNVPTEWAQRVAPGPLPAGRVRGVCSGCGTPLSVSDKRPLKIACPECGRTRLLA